MQLLPSAPHALRWKRALRHSKAHLTTDDCFSVFPGAITVVAVRRRARFASGSLLPHPRLLEHVYAELNPSVGFLMTCDLTNGGTDVVVCVPQVCVEVLVEYPFFVFGQGWSSCCPDRTTELFELSCAKLCVGDVCVSLTLRSLRNGSLAESQRAKAAPPPGQCHSADAAVRNSTSPNGAHASRGLLMKASREPPSAPGLFPGQGEGVCGPLAADSRTREVRQESAKTGDAERPAGRKRRWSAPERDQTERAEEEPPPTLPRPSFVPQEVKISIEGHSNAGSERCLNKM